MSIGGSRFLNSILWTFLQQFSVQIINFLVQIVIARQIGPKAFGVIALLNVFIVISNDLVDGGMSSSLIRNRNTDQRDYSTIFFMNIAMSIGLYLVLFISAPYIADYYKMDVLDEVLRIYGLCVIAQSFLVIQRTKLTKEMNFRQQTFISLPATLIGGIIGIAAAYLGYGVWSLVALGLSKLFIEVVLYNWVVKWRPTLYFNKRRLLYHFNYGYKLTLAGILNNIFNNIYSIVIGKAMGAGMLGLYDRAYQLRQVLLQNITTALNKVTFPMFAEVQNDIVKFKKIYRDLMLGVFMLTAFVLLILGINAENIFKILFTKEWYAAIPIFQLICIAGLLFPLHSYNLNVLKVKGKSNLFLKLEILKKILTIIILVASFKYGIYGIIYGMIINSFLAFFINSYYSGKEIDYTSWAQLIDVFPIVLVSGVTYIVTFEVKKLFLDHNVTNSILNLIVTSVVFTILYFSSVFLAQRNKLYHLFQLFKK